jgi:hypothetical protein
MFTVEQLISELTRLKGLGYDRVFINTPAGSFPLQVIPAKHGSTEEKCVLLTITRGSTPLPSPVWLRKPAPLSVFQVTDLKPSNLNGRIKEVYEALETGTFMDTNAVARKLNYFHVDGSEDTEAVRPYLSALTRSHLAETRPHPGYANRKMYRRTSSDV